MEMKIPSGAGMTHNADSVNSIKWMHIDAIHIAVFCSTFVTILEK